MKLFHKITPFFLNNQKFKQPLRKSLISKQLAGANKRRKLNNPLRELAKTLFLQRKPKRNAHFGLASSKVCIHTLGIPAINYGDVQKVWIFKERSQ